MRPTLHISRSRFLQNIQAVRARISPSALMLVMKDDAYGHGIEWAADAAAAAGVDWFGSYDVRSGVRLREALGDRPGRVFAWATSPREEIEQALDADLDLGVGTAEYLRLVIETARERTRTARVHLKIDTGLHRNGIRPEDWPAVVGAAREAERAGLVNVVGVWSHLAEASDIEDDDAHSLFAAAVDQLRAAGSRPEVQHLTASAASWWRPELRGSMSRIGAFCYGIRSAEGPELDGIRPVAALTAPVIAVEGESAIIAVGSFDGLPSTLAGAGVGTPAGARQLRRIGETTSIVDAWPGAAIGSTVSVFGPGDHGEVSATALAERIDTVGEEVITRLTSRVRRVMED